MKICFTKSQLTDFYNKVKKNPEAFAAGSLALEDKDENAYIRDNTITPNDLEEAKAILFGEISNRSLDKQKLEAQTILNTAFNRMDEYRKRGQEKTLTEVLQMKNQYQAYNGAEYKRFKQGKLNDTDKRKVEAINAIIEQILDGSFQNNIGNRVFYKHLSDGRIIADSRKLFR